MNQKTKKWLYAIGLLAVGTFGGQPLLVATGVQQASDLATAEVADDQGVGKCKRI